jgi:hypothetical protein
MQIRRKPSDVSEKNSLDGILGGVIVSVICLVSCSSRKRIGRHPAKDLYISDLFRKSRLYAENNSDRWGILSAKYGLLHPDDIVESYDVTLKTMPIAVRREWSAHVFQELKSMLTAGDRIISLAGDRYMSFSHQAYQNTVC